ncbi:MFS general substrate transporter [Xylariaceae sp. FL0594]|nr:MFS general substrate transporter [Xylariaceae sp. FL0594]
MVDTEKDVPPETQPPTTGTEPLETKRKLKGVFWFVVIAAVLSSTFLYALDNTVTANVRPSIVETFGRLDVLTWLSVSYPLGEVGSNPFLYLSALFIFEVGSAVIGSAQSAAAVIVGRAIAGVGGSGIYVGTVSVISAMTTPAERNQYLGFIGMTWCLGTILGPVVGGAFADSSATWRWAFYINLVIAAVAAPACIFLIPHISPHVSSSAMQRIKRLDYVGSALFLGGVVSIIMILGFGGAIYVWDSGQLIGLYVATVVIWLVFCLQQRFSLLTADRIFPAQFVGDWEMVNFFSWTAIAISNLVVTVYTLPLFFQFVYGDTSLRAAVFTLPFIGATVVSVGVSAPLFARAPVYMAWFAGSAAVMLVGAGLLTTIDYHTSRGAIVGFTVIQALGVGPVIQLAYTAAQVKVPRASVPAATAFLTCAQMAGLALSLGIATSVFLNRATEGISAILPGASHELIQASIDGARTALFASLSPELRLRVHQVLADQAATVFYLNVAGAALGFVTSFLMKRERLQLDTDGGSSAL